MLATKTSKLQQELEESAISTEIARLNFIEYPENFNEDNEAVELLTYGLGKEARKNDGRLSEKYNFIAQHICSGGWWCGTLNPDGTASEWGCFKPNDPWKNKEGKVVKYATPCKVDTQPFFLKIDRATWQKIAVNAGLEPPELEGLPDNSIPHEFWSWVISRPGLSIVITEGAKKTASLLSAGFCAVGLSGIWNGIKNPLDEVKGSKSGEHHLVPQLEAIAQKGREFIFCFDNDEKPKTKAAVNKAIAKTAELLTRQTGLKTYGVMKWGEYADLKGIDDVHAAKGAPELWRIYDERTKKKIVITKSEEQQYKEKLEIAAAILEANGDRLENYIKTNGIETNGKGKAEAKTSTPLQPVVTYIEAEDPDAGLPLEEEEEPERPPSLTFQEICYQQLYCKGKDRYIALNEKEIFKFNGKYYEQQSPVVEKRRIFQWAENYVVKEKGRRSYAHMKPSSINSIWEWVLKRLNTDLKELNPAGFNFDNGILRLSWDGNKPKWKLHPHHPNEKYLYCSLVKYDPKASPEMCDRLFAALDPHSVTVLMRNLSAIFDMDRIRKLHGRMLRAGFAVGSGNNGKDTFRDIVMLLFPERVQSIPLTKFVEYDKTGEATLLRKLEGCWVNWSTENNQETPLDKVQSLNYLVSGEKGVFEVRSLYEDAKSVKESPKTVYIFNCNNPPIIKSGLESIQSRIVVYNFNKTFKPNPDLSKGQLQADPRFKYDEQFQIEQVAPAFLNRMISEFELFLHEGIDYEPLDRGILDLREKSTHLWSFVADEGLEANENGEVWLSELWEKLEKWYLDNGTLEKRELYDGSIKRIWNDQPLRFDPNVTGMNQVFNRLQKLFPHISKAKATNDPLRKNQTFIRGISFASASLPHNPVISTNSALPSGSLCLTNNESGLPNIPPSISNEKGGKAEGKAEGNPAVSQKSLHRADGEAGKAKSLKNSQEHRNGDKSFAIGDRLIDTRTGEELTVLKLPEIGATAVKQEYLCQRDNAWFPLALLKRKGIDLDENAPIEVGHIVEDSETKELLEVKALSEDALWAWCERNEILIPKRYLQFPAV